MPRVGWAVLIVLVAGCAPASDSDATGGAERTVALTIRHRSEWRVLWVEGDTDLPDGAYVNYRVTHALARTAPVEEWPVQNLIASGRAAVQNGEYWARVNTLNWPAGSVSVLVQFPLPPQPPEIIEHYGAFGEHLTGENVSVMNGMKAVQVEHTLEHRP